jgi:hypothetical protein
MCQCQQRWSLLYLRQWLPLLSPRQQRWSLRHLRRSWLRQYPHFHYLRHMLPILSLPGLYHQ